MFKINNKILILILIVIVTKINKYCYSNIVHNCNKISLQFQDNKILNKSIELNKIEEPKLCSSVFNIYYKK